MAGFAEQRTRKRRARGVLPRALPAPPSLGGSRRVFPPPQGSPLTRRLLGSLSPIRSFSLSTNPHPPFLAAQWVHVQFAQVASSTPNPGTTCRGHKLHCQPIYKYTLHRSSATHSVRVSIPFQIFKYRELICYQGKSSYQNYIQGRKWNWSISGEGGTLTHFRGGKDTSKFYGRGGDLPILGEEDTLTQWEGRTDLSISGEGGTLAHSG